MVANDAHLHLLLNHLPIIGSLISALLLACGLAAKSKDLTRAALALTVLFAVVTYPAAGSGHEAEEVIEHMTGISEDRIEAHEERAEKAGCRDVRIGRRRPSGARPGIARRGAALGVRALSRPAPRDFRPDGVDGKGGGRDQPS